MSQPDDSPAGILLSVHMINFMKHDNLLIDLKPHANFITGRNGSGKSSILVALSIGLGSNTRLSGRGNNMIDLIKDGRNEATIIITIKNSPYGYKMDQYGDKIVVTRKLRRSGTQSWEISNFPKTGKVHDELVRILQFYNIQIDNPCSIMHQDTAREFIGTSSPQKKYELFMRGTLLTSLNDDIEKITKNIKLVEQRKEERLAEKGELDYQFDDIKEKYDTVEEADDILNRIHDLENELVWSYYRVSAQKQEKADKELENAQKQLEQANKKLEEKQQIVEQAKINKQESDKRVSDELNKLQNIKREKDQVAKQLDKIKIERSNKKRELGKLNNQIQRAKAELAKKNKEKSDLEKKKEDQENTNNERNRLIAELEDKQSDAEKELKESERELYELSSQYREAENNLTQLKNVLRQKENELKSISQKLETLKSVYGKDGQSNPLYTKIRQSNKFSCPPIGPLSSYMKLKDESWGIALQQILGNVLNNFIVNSHEDELELRKLVGKQSNFGVIIYDYSKPRFGYNQKPPARGCQILIDKLNIQQEEIVGKGRRGQEQFTANTRDIITNILIDIKNADRIWCVEEESVARSLAFGSHHLLTIIKSGVQFKYQSGYELRIGARSNQCRIGVDESERIAQYEQAQNNAMYERDEAKEHCDRQNRELQELKNERKRLDRNRQMCKENLSKIQRQLQNMPDETDNYDTKLGVILETIQKIEENIETDENKIPDLENQISDLKESKSSLMDQINAFSAQLNRAEDFKKESDKYYNEERNAKIELDKAQRSRDQIDSQITKLSQEALKAKEDATTNLSKARQHSPDAEEKYKDTARPTQELANFLLREKKNYENAQKLSGLNFNDIRMQYNKIKNEVEKANTFIRELDEFIEKANKARQDRYDKLVSIIHSITRRAKMSFQNYQRQRKYVGKLHFRHDQQTIDIAVKSKADTDFTDVSNLSGGEKSYSLVSLLLSLWEVMECPFYCVDEFDVFMDEINRQAATSLLIKGASVMENRQFIFITPLSLDHLKNNDKIAIFEVERTEA